MNDLGKRIAARRKILGLKQQDLARIAGYNVSHISMIECGRRTPHVKTLAAVAEALQTTAGALLSDNLPTTIPSGVESLVAYLLARDATDEQVRKVEALARVLLEAA